jgi:hypothetical protein
MTRAQRFKSKAKASIYDAESNIQVLGKFHMLLNVSDEDKKVVQMTTQINQRSTGYNVSGVIRGK